MVFAHLALSVVIAAPNAIDQAQAEWAKAWAQKPDLVSLGQLGSLAGSNDRIQQTLEARIKVLGKKTFSNREWKSYWQRQKELALNFGKALELGGRGALAQAMRSWAQLAEEKIKNQDVYLAAIESERDAIETRLEAALNGEKAPPVPPAASSSLSPFQRRQLELQELEQRIFQQNERISASETNLKLIVSQRAATKQLLEALRNDVRLGTIEAKLSAQEAKSAVVPWAALWSPIAATTANKAQKLRQEVRLGEAHIRSLQIEETLVQSQIAYRRQKTKELKDQAAAAGSAQRWMDATVATVKAWMLESLWKVVLALIGLWLLLRVALGVIGRLTHKLEHVADDDDDDTTSQAEQRAGTIASVFRGLAVATAYAVAGLTALEVIGVNTGPILGSVAILGLAVSFGSQNLVRDVVNGFFILIENQYAVGDVVTLGGCTGTVEKINLRSTRVRQFNGTLHVIPNGQINTVANQTRDWARAVVEVGVSYDADLAVVEEVVHRVGAEMAADEAWAELIDEPAVMVGVVALADSSVKVRCVAQVKAGHQWAYSRALQRALKEAFDAQGIEIPFPQRVVHQK